MENVGEFNSGARWPVLDRRTAHYRDSLTLARQLLQSYYRDLEIGNADAWTFLIKTPDMIEVGIRTILQRELCGIEKRGRQLENATMTLNPDIVVDDGAAVADVKYKIAGDDWNRADLYQIVAFATGYRARRAALISFRRPDVSKLAPIRVGDVSIEHLTWLADPNQSPDAAAVEFVSDFARWCGASTGRASAAVA